MCHKYCNIISYFSPVIYLYLFIRSHSVKKCDHRFKIVSIIMDNNCKCFFLSSSIKKKFQSLFVKAIHPLYNFSYAKKHLHCENVFFLSFFLNLCWFEIQIFHIISCEHLKHGNSVHDSVTDKWGTRRLLFLSTVTIYSDNRDILRTLTVNSFYVFEGSSTMSYQQCQKKGT